MDTSIAQISRALDAFLRPEQDERQARKRDRILAAAVEQFVAHGYRKTSMDAVARQAGVAKGTLYLYYRNKAELLFHAVTQEKQKHLEHLRPLDAGGLKPRDRLHHYVVIGLTMSLRMPLVTRLVGGDREFLLALEEVDADLLERVNRLQMAITVSLLDDASGQALPRAELERRARVLIDLMYGIVTSGRLEQPVVPIEDYAQLVADMIIGGLLAAPATVRADAATSQSEGEE